jgi:hypothetical protein
MSFLVTAVAVCASGVGLLGALGLRTRRWAVDVPMGWFVGAGWIGLAMLALRILLGVPYVAATAVAVLSAPLAAWGVREAWRRRQDGAQPPEPAPAPPPVRWIPRPAWLFAPVALYVALVLVVVVLHGLNSPTETDDGFRVRAYAPLLAHADRWEPAARSVLWMAGPVPTWVPSLAWRLGFPVDHFHVNATVLASLLAFLALAVGLASARGRPEEGWGTAFVVLSLPLLAYHVTTTYADAPLALFLGAAFLLLVAWGRSGDPADAARALLLLLAAAQVKREGEILAGTLVVALLAQAAWRARREGRALPLRLALLLSPFALVVVARLVASGTARSFDLVSLLAARGSAGLSAGAPASAAAAARPVGPIFADALLGLGSTGLLYWVLPVAVLLLFPAARRAGLLPSLAALALLFAQVAAASLWLFPEFTRDQTTVHRALLPVSVPAAAWLAAVIAAACAGTPPATAPPARSARAAPGSSGGSGARRSTRGGGGGSRGSRR